MIKGYKGFGKDWTCHGHKFEVGKTYTHKSEIKLCESGFHFCENPLDVLRYYSPTDSNFAEVEANNVSDEKSNDTKRVCSEIKIGAKITLSAVIQAGVSFLVSTCKNKSATSGNYSHSATSGDYSPSATSGDFSHGATSGDYSHSATSGNYSHSATSGYSSPSATSGDYSHSATSGNSSHVPRQAITATVPRQAIPAPVPRQAITATVPRQAITATVLRQAITAPVPRQAITAPVRQKVKTQSPLLSVKTQKPKALWEIGSYCLKLTIITTCFALKQPRLTARK